jgi:hypothetical protein
LVQWIDFFPFVGIHWKQLPLVAPDTAALGALIENDQLAGIGLDRYLMHRTVALRTADQRDTLTHSDS